MLRPLIRPIVRPLVRRVTAPSFGWSPIVLFAAGEQGAWYDPSDLSTLYQDAAGTTPVTALGQPVGLMLDKSKGLVLGPELAANGDFSNGATGWTVTGADSTHIITFAGGTMRYQSDTTSPVLALANTPTSPLVGGRRYQVTVVVSARASGSLKIDSSDNNPFTFGTSTGTFTGSFIATGPTFSVVRNSINVDVTIDSISIRELPGNHASQPTGTARPVLVAGNKIDYDGVDDKLTTTFPDLGTAVTIVRSVPGTGASILTGQTIGAGARDDSTDHHGLLIINRALTAPETALVTRWANMRAGV